MGPFPLVHPWAVSSTVWGRRADLDLALPIMDEPWHSGPFQGPLRGQPW